MIFNSKGNFGGYKRSSHQLDLPIILSVQEECFLSTTPKELLRDSEIIMITLYEAKVHLGIEMAFISLGERGHVLLGRRNKESTIIGDDDIRFFFGVSLYHSHEPNATLY